MFKWIKIAFLRPGELYEGSATQIGGKFSCEKWEENEKKLEKCKKM